MASILLAHRVSQRRQLPDEVGQLRRGCGWGVEQNPLPALVEGLRDEWTFAPDGEGTVIRWTYGFKPRRDRYLLVRRGLAPLWRHFVQAGIEAAARACE